MILESGQRLSRSKLWQLQRAYFERAGIDAWGSATVPHYITCNAFIAEAYAQVVHGWLRDQTLDPKEPVYLVELGAGSGRFAFLFLKKLQALLARSPLAGLRFTYVMTDFTDASMKYWREHKSFRPLVAEGKLDFARFDIEKDQTLALVESGKTIERTVNPLALLANYYFDSIPQDVFFAQEGKLFECLATLTVPDEHKDTEDPEEILKKLELTYDDRPVEGAYYNDPELDKILAGYRELVKSSAVKFPLSGIEVCRSFARMSGDRLLLLSGDKGFVHEDTLEGQKRPGLALHGSFSMNVNYHALAQLFVGRGGQVFTMDHHHNSLNVVAFSVGSPTLETSAAYTAAIEGFGPDDYFLLRKGIDQREDLTIEQAMSLLRLSRYDPRLLRQILPVLRKHGPKSSATTKREVLILVNRVMDLYFHIQEEQDLLFSAGVLVFELRDYERAIELFMASVELYGVDAGSAYNLALAHYRQERPQVALEWAKAALTAEPAHVAARRLKEELEVATSAGA